MRVRWTEFDRRSVLMAGCVLLTVLATQVGGRSDSLAHRLSFQLIALLGLTLSGLGAWRQRHALGRSGLLCFLALASAYIGATGRSVNTLDLNSQAFPSWTDGCFLATYLCLMGATLTIVRRQKVAWNAASVIDAATLTVGVSVLLYNFVIADVAADPSVPLAARVVGTLYLLCDALVVGAMARLLFSSSGHRAPALLLVGGMSALLIGDAGLIRAVAAGAGGYPSWIDVPYLWFFLLIAFALWQRETPRLVDVRTDPTERLGPLRIGALTVGALLAPATLLVQDLRGHDAHVRAVAIGASILFILTLARLSLLVRALEAQSRQLAVLAQTDGLTGLANRTSFDFELGRAMRESLEAVSGERPPVTVGLLNLDDFTQFNDIRGHSRGDQLLRECAAHWTHALGRLAPGSFMARHGGEQFAVIFRGQDSRTAAEILEHLILRTPMEQTFSAGLASWRADEPAQSLIKRADERLYTAKSAGGMRVVGGRLTNATQASRPTAELPLDGNRRARR
jgi:diguanylate cyclase (GGDEF)-like protein